MCSNYLPVTRWDRLLQYFGVERDRDEMPLELDPEVWPGGMAPFIRRAQEGSGHRRIEAGQFGLLPGFAKELAFGRRTYNARSETVHELPSYRRAWARGQRCIVPAEAIFEPCYESGRAQRWRIQPAGGAPMGIAGIWERHPQLTGRDGQPLLSFSMLTVNAAGHVVFQRMHRPTDEKRMVVLLDPAEYDRWLCCSLDEARTFFRQWQGPLETFAAALPPRTRRAPPEPPPNVRPDDEPGSQREPL
jgi:putative SOS response-associated peptidase YedK